MENKTERTINLVALLLVIAFTALSCFTCFEFYFTRWNAIGGEGEGVTTFTRGETHNIPVVVALGILQTVFLCVRQRITARLSMWCSVLGVLVTGYEVIQRLLETTLQSMGGLGSTDFKITIIGYVVIALSVINMIVQIISVKKKKEGNEQ